MSILSDVMRDVFDRGAETEPIQGSRVGARLTREDETRAVADVVAGGSAGLVTLIYAYAPALRGAAARYRGTLGDEEARAVVLAALVETCHSVKPGDVLAGVIVDRLTDALATAAGRTGSVPVPTRTLKRYLSVLRKADGDPALAAKIAPDFSLSRESFHAIHAAVWGWASLDGFSDEGDGLGGLGDAEPLWDRLGDFAEAEDRIMAEAALAAVDGLERDVCRAAYGFAEFRPLSDGEIAEQGWAGSRASVQRTRTRALGKMRDALGLGE